MEDIKLIEEKIEGIRGKINEQQILKIENNKYPVVDEILKEVNALVDYIRKRDKWIKTIIDILCFLEEKIKIEKSGIKNDEQRKEIEEKIEKKIFAMRNGIEREFLYDPDSLIERLKSDGNKVLNNSSLREAIDGIGFRLLEKVRLGQRDEVLYLLLRTFKAHEQKVPESLIEALKTKYDDNLFKSFIYAFLAPILGGKQQTKGGES